MIGSGAGGDPGLHWPRALTARAPDPRPSRCSGPALGRSVRRRVEVKAALIRNVRVDDQQLTFILTDGREVSAPTSWSQRLTNATEKQRGTWRLGGFGTYVEWPSIDEHIGLWTLLGVSEEDVMEAAGFETGRSSVRS